MGRVFFALIAGLGIALFASGAPRFASFETVVAYRDQLQSLITEHRTLAIICYVFIYAVAVSLFIPATVVLSVVAGAIFGWSLGAVVALLSATIGASVVFAVARSAFGTSLATSVGPKAAKFQAGFCDNALSYMLFLRLVPAFPFFLVNVVPAILGVPFRTYLIGTFFGIMPASVALSSAGAGLDSAIKTAKQSQSECIAKGLEMSCPLTLKLVGLITPELKIAIILLSVLALMPAALKFWRRRHG